MLTRRQMLAHSSLLAAAMSRPGLFAEELTITPAMTEGPFYPDRLPIDTDNDLLVINDSITPAVGEITYLTGRVLSRSGQPIRNAFVEIWQCDHSGVYLHSADNNNRANQDKNFQGYGRFVTDSKGRYSFRTIKPVPYPGRTPHIHFGVSRNGHRVFTTQMLIKGHEQNAGDGVFRAIRDQKLRDSVLVDFTPLQGSRLGELEASFDIVLGKTAEEFEDGKLGIGKPDRVTRRQRR